MALNSEESVYYSVAICLEGRSQKSKYCSRGTPAKETFGIHKRTSQSEKKAPHYVRDTPTTDKATLLNNRELCFREFAFSC